MRLATSLSSFEIKFLKKRIKLKDSVDTRSRGDKVMMNKIRLEITRFLTIKRMVFWNSFTIKVVRTRKPN